MTEFYEDDEPIEKIRAAFEAGEKGLTGPPSDEFDVTEAEFDARMAAAHPVADETDTTEAEALAMIAEGQPVDLIGGIRVSADACADTTFEDCRIGSDG